MIYVFNKFIINKLMTKIKTALSKFHTFIWLLFFYTK